MLIAWVIRKKYQFFSFSAKPQYFQHTASVSTYRDNREKAPKPKTLQEAREWPAIEPVQPLTYHFTF
jgi:hypothetical protein